MIGPGIDRDDGVEHARLRIGVETEKDFRERHVYDNALRCAGPNICTACFAPLMVTLVISTVAGLASKFGVSTANKFEWPSLCRARALANAPPTGPSLLPIKRSIWAISFPSPASASPMNIL